MARTNMTDFARILGLSKGQVSKLASRGMPVDDVEAAKQWRRRNLDPSWTKPDRAAQAMPFADDPVGVVLRRLIPPIILSPELIAGVCADAEIDIDGNGMLRLAESFSEAYKLVIDRALGDDGEYNIPDYLRGVDRADREGAIEYLEKLLSLYRLLDEDDRLVTACAIEVKK